MMTSNKILVVSDIHLGNKRTKTSKIITNLRSCLFKKENQDIKVMFLAGDVFDTLLKLNDPDLVDIKVFIKDLLTFCNIFKIKLRILEGTPSHDWKQSLLFITLADLLQLRDLDIKYIDTIHVEIIKDLNMSVLYIPDEIQPTTDKTLAIAKTVIANSGLDKVDIAIMHGQFDYQLPAHIKKIPRHSSDEYLALVKKAIFIGHVHTFSMYKRIIAQGSFDRLSHNEEEKKGYVVANIRENDFDVFFVENENARKYITIDCSEMDLDKLFITIKQTVSSIEPTSAIRIKASHNHPIFSNMKLLFDISPTISWTKLIKDQESDKEEENNIFDVSDSYINYSPVSITPDNIVELLIARLKNKTTDQLLLLKSTDILLATK